MKKLVVVGNGMAGVACVEQILKLRATFRDHRLRRRDTRRTTTAFCSLRCSRARSRPTISCSTGSSGTGSNDIDLRARRPRSSTSIRERQDRHGRRRQRHAIRQADDRHGQPRAGSRRSPVLDKKNVFTFRTLDDTRALLERARPGAQAVVIGGGLARARSCARLQVQGCDVTVVHLLRHADGARSSTPPAAGICGEDGRASAFACCWRARPARSSGNGTRGGCAVRPTATTLEADLVVVAAGHPAQRGAGAQGRPRRSTAASSSTTTWRRRTPTFSPWANAPSTTAVSTAWSRRSRTGQGARRHDHRQPRAGVSRARPGREAEDHGRRCVLRRRLREADRRRDRCATRTPALGHLQEAAAPRTTGSPA